MRIITAEQKTRTLLVKIFYIFVLGAKDLDIRLLFHFLIALILILLKIAVSVLIECRIFYRTVNLVSCWALVRVLYSTVSFIRLTLKGARFLRRNYGLRLRLFMVSSPISSFATFFVKLNRNQVTFFPKFLAIKHFLLLKTSKLNPLIFI